MLRIDNRTGSVELLPKLKAFGLSTEKARLEFGDFAWNGNGPLGECAIAVERKTIHDLIQSMRSRRLSGHQLPGLLANYDYVYLIVEGLWRPGRDGQLEIRNGGWSSNYGKALSYRMIDNYLTTLELAGVFVRRTGRAEETVWMLVDLYKYWTEKKWCGHSSAEAIYAPAPERRRSKFSFKHRPVGLAEKVAYQLPGLDSKVWDVVKKFPTVEDMLGAEEKDWIAAKVGIGKVGAAKIVNAHGWRRAKPR